MEETREGIWAEGKVLQRDAEMGGYVGYFGEKEPSGVARAWGVWNEATGVEVLGSDQRSWAKQALQARSLVPHSLTRLFCLEMGIPRRPLQAGSHPSARFAKFILAPRQRLN